MRGNRLTVFRSESASARTAVASEASGWIASALASLGCSSARTRFSSSSTRLESSSTVPGDSFIFTRSGSELVARGDLRHVLRGPRRQQLNQYPQNEEWHECQHHSDQ